MMQVIRSNAGKYIVVPFIVLFLGWMVFEIGLGVGGGGQQALARGELGTVNGRPITTEAYNAMFQQIYEQARQGAEGSFTAEQMKELRDRAWEQLVDETLIRAEMERRGIRATDAEILFAARNVPHPQLQTQEIFQTNGQFDLAKYQKFLAGPTANAELFGQLEAYYRDMIPRNKLIRQVTAGAHVSDAELWRAFQDRTETATVEYVALDLARLSPSEPRVSDAEVREWYDDHKDQFKRPASARMTIAYIPLTVTDADRAASLAKAQQVRAEIAGGADFAEVAKRESADKASGAAGGDLGTFGRGSMVPAFEAAAFSLPVGEVSQPVQTQFGWHLIQVQEKVGEQVKARHILIPIEKSEEEMDRLAARADSLERIARADGIERAARLTNATIRSGLSVSEAAPFVPGIGSALEAVEWARDESRAAEEDRKPISDVFDTPQAFFVAKWEGYTEAGEMPLSEATPQIRRELIVKKKRDQARVVGQQLVAQARAGKTLQQVAASRGLTVATTGPFTRVEPNPIFGQANAVTGAAFGTPLNQVSDVVEAPSGLFIVRPIARVAADRQAWEAQKQQQRMTTLYSMQQEEVQRWMASLRKEAKIVDRRDQMQAAS